jgi:hypothetical protein
MAKVRSYLKKVFFPNLCVRPSFQVLDILEYACGFKLGPALTLSQNPIFEMASSLNFANVKRYANNFSLQMTVKIVCNENVQKKELKR